jgi:hypothetical protein
MTRTPKSILTATLAALTLGATVIATSTPAAAWHRHGGWHRGGGWGGGAVAAGVVGALALGAIAASAAPSCYLTSQPVVNRWGRVVAYRRVRVCE